METQKKKQVITQIENICIENGINEKEMLFFLRDIAMRNIKALNRKTRALSKKVFGLCRELFSPNYECTLFESADGPCITIEGLDKWEKVEISFHIIDPLDEIDDIFEANICMTTKDKNKSAAFLRKQLKPIVGEYYDSTYEDEFQFNLSYDIPSSQTIKLIKALAPILMAELPI